MPIRTCPECGSKNVKKIFYGYPSFRAVEAAKRGEIILGGCCVEPDSPNYKCLDCKKGFAGFHKQLLSEFKSLEFFIGGHFGPSHYVWLEATPKENIIKYGYSSDGRIIDLKQSESDELCEAKSIKIKHTELNDEQLSCFLQELGELEVDLWEKSYMDTAILDGTQWELTLELAGQGKLTKSGCNAYPLGWRRFLDLIKLYLEEDIL